MYQNVPHENGKPSKIPIFLLLNATEAHNYQIIIMCLPSAICSPSSTVEDGRLRRFGFR